MSSSDKIEYPIACECGHSGTALRETNDNGYAKRYYEDWSLIGFECVNPTFFSGIKLTPTDAVRECKPTCPECGSTKIVAS